MARRKPDPNAACPVEHTLAVIGGKWKPMLLFHLLGGTLRFSELRRRIPNATEQMLTLHLRELERDGLVLRTVHPEVPPRVEYTLTEAALALEPVFLAMGAWAETYRPRLRACSEENIPNRTASVVASRYISE